MIGDKTYILTNTSVFIPRFGLYHFTKTIPKVYITKVI